MVTTTSLVLLHEPCVCWPTYGMVGIPLFPPKKSMSQLLVWINFCNGRLIEAHNPSVVGPTSSDHVGVNQGQRFLRLGPPLRPTSEPSVRRSLCWKRRSGGDGERVKARFWAVQLRQLGRIDTRSLTDTFVSPQTSGDGWRLRADGQRRPAPGSLEEAGAP